MPGEYDLGKAHGRIVIETDQRGARRAEAAMDNVGKSAQRTAEGFEHAEKAASEWEKQSKRSKAATDRETRAHERNTAAMEAAAKAGEARKKATKEYNDLLADETASEEKLTKALNVKNRAIADHLRLAKEQKKAQKELNRILSGTTLEVDSKAARKELDDYAKEWKRFNAEIIKQQKARNRQIAAEEARHRRELKKAAGILGDGADIAGGVGKGTLGAVGRTAAVGSAGLGIGALGGLAGLAGSAGIGGIASALASVTAAVGQMSGALGVLPAAIGSVATVVGTLQVATMGFEDAMKNLGTEDFEKGLKDLSQNARDAAWTLNALYPALMDIRKGVQDRFMQNFAQNILKGFQVLGPTIENTMNSIATTANRVLQGVFDDLTSGQGLADFQSFMDNTVKSFDILGDAAQPFFEAFRSIMAVGGSFLPQIAESIRNLATDFNSFIQSARADGSLAQFFQDGIDAVKLFMNSLKEIGQGIGNILSIQADTGGGFLDWLNRVAQAFNAWTSSASGQEAIRTFFEATKRAMDALAPVLGPLAESLLAIFVAFADLGTALAPSFVEFFKSFADTIKQLTPNIVALSGPIGQFLGLLATTLGQLVTSLGPQLPKLFEGLVSALEKLAPILVQAVDAFAGLLENMSAEDIGNVMLLVGALGAMFSVVGPLLGAIGSLAGLAGALGITFGGAIVVVGGIVAVLALLGGTIATLVANWETYQNIISNSIIMITQHFARIKSAIVDSIESLIEAVPDMGRKIIQGLIDGMLNMLGPIGRAGKTLMDTLSEFFPSSPAKKGPFSGKGWTPNRGEALVEGFADGIASGTPAAIGSTEGMMSGMSKSMDGGLAETSISSMISDLKEINSFAQRLTGTLFDIGNQVIEAMKLFTTNPLTGESLIPKTYRKTVSDEQLAKNRADKAYRDSIRGDNVAPGTYGASGPIADMLRQAGLNPTGGNTPGSVRPSNQDTIPLKQNADGTWTSTDPEWAKLIKRESGGNPTITQGNIGDINNLTGDLATGLFQITGGTWKSNGGLEFAPSAREATPEQQALIAARIFNSRGGQPWGSGPGNPFGRENEELLRKGIQRAGTAPPGGAIPNAAKPAILNDINGRTSQAAPAAVAGLIAQMFPQIGTIGGARNDSMPYHREGRALDIMIPNYKSDEGKGLGNQIRDWLQSNAGAIGLEDTIWQDFWQPAGGGEGKKLGRSGDTQGHFDHVHATFKDGAEIDLDGNTATLNLPGKAPVVFGPTRAPTGPVSTNQPGTVPVDRRGNRNRTEGGRPANSFYDARYPAVSPGAESHLQDQFAGLGPDAQTTDILSQIETNTGSTDSKMDEQLRAFLDGNPQLNAAIEAAQPGASEKTINDTLMQLDSEIARQNALDTPESRYLADQLGSQRSQIMSDTGFSEQQNPLDVASQIASGAAGLANDIFKVVGSTLDAINATADITSTLVRGIENTEDIGKIIDNIQTYITVAADVAKAVSSGLGLAAGIAGAAGGADPSGGASGASAALGMASSIAGMISSVLTTINAVIDLTQEAARIGGKYFGRFLGILAGGSGGGLLGDVKFLLDMNDRTLKAYSGDNPDDKRSHALIGGSREDTRQHGIRDINMYVGPGTDPYEATNAMMWSIKTDSQGVYAYNDF